LRRPSGGDRLDGAEPSRSERRQKGGDRSQGADSGRYNDVDPDRNGEPADGVGVGVLSEERSCEQVADRDSGDTADEGRQPYLAAYAAATCIGVKPMLFRIPIRR
jgi:hypothetical protein